MADDVTGAQAQPELVKGPNGTPVRTSPASWLRKPVESVVAYAPTIGSSPTIGSAPTVRPVVLSHEDEGLFGAPVPAQQHLAPQAPQAPAVGPPTAQVLAQSRLGSTERGLFDLQPDPDFVDVPVAAQHAANEAILAAERQVQQRPILPINAALAHEAAAAQVAASVAAASYQREAEAIAPPLATPQPIQQRNQQGNQHLVEPTSHQVPGNAQLKLAVSEPLVSEPLVSEPLVSEPVVIEPVVIEPVALRPIPVLTSPRSLSAAARASLPTAADGTVASVKRGWLRRPAGRDEPEKRSAAPVDPSQLPPPSRPGLIIAQPVPLDDRPGQHQSRRDRKKLRRTQAQAQQEHNQAVPAPAGYSQNQPTIFVPQYAQQSYAQTSYAQPTAAQILDTRVPGKSQTDIAFVVPLVPAMVVATASTFLWFQAGVRLENTVIVAPIFIGLMVGGIMRMGTKSLDFARIIFAVILTSFATLVGHSWIVRHPKGSYLSWSEFPALLNTDPLSTFMTAADRSLGEATVMFFGLVAAAVVSSLKSR
jgi:hypothetical protein